MTGTTELGIVSGEPYAPENGRARGSLPTPAAAREGRRPEPDLADVACKLRAAFEALGLDLADPNLAGTEWRVA